MHPSQELSLYLEAVETIRKEKGLSIERLIEEITSERSYRRYLNAELPIPLDVLEKLISKLDVQIADILIYALKVKQKPSGIIEYFTYVHYQEHTLSKPYYETLKTYNKDTKILNTLVQMVITYDDYQREIISLEMLQSILEKNLPTFDPEMKTIESLCFYILYASIHHDFSHHETIMRSLLEKKFYMSQILLFDIFIDRYLIFLAHDDDHQDDYIKLSQLFFQVAHMWQDAYFIYSAYIHQAYQKFLTSDETYRIDLHRHLFYARMLSSKETTLYDFIIKKMVDIPIDIYLKNVLQEVLS